MVAWIKTLESVNHDGEYYGCSCPSLVEVLEVRWDKACVH